MSNFTILWADDEIDLLKPHIMFLKAKGYDVVAVNNGHDALDIVGSQPVDIIILDENMPGLTGLETLQRIKQIAPHIPVLMITKSEEENIMDQAVGSKIADYLIKPVNPNQILLSIKKNLHSESLVSRRTTSDYQQEFSRIASLINDSYTIDDWMETYRKLVFWDIELASADTNMDELLEMQKIEANSTFGKFVKKNYEKWVTDPDDPRRPLMSPDIFKRRIFPMLDAGDKVFFILIDNFRLDQWRAVKPLLTDVFNAEEDLYCSILPTATQYARNAIFSGLMPLDISRMFPDLWVDEESPEGKNLNESPLIATQFERHRRRCRFSYNKINDSTAGERLLRDFAALEDNDLNVIVFNFIDMLSHARTESKMIRELASSNAAYRSLTESWFRHSGILDILRRIAEKGYKIVLTTDHGTVRVDNPVKVVGDKNTNTNLRYKVGKNLSYNPKQVYEIKKPERFGLPSPNISSTYIFATNREFFAYPNNYNYYVQYYEGTFQHGGISLEEMLVPLVTLTAK
ncbi:MAG: bifunctional response regulator/alkaline phosphatase family protein [Duncaniella sp.]|nr:bifunctional response regulator/alkaline phosphatase family protein [Duncaniella sp.]HBI57929.1 two-component system response regulator [Porphyromonadaceae bacterium]